MPNDDTPERPHDADADADPVGHFVERFAVVLAESGMPRMPSRVLACLLVSEDGQLTAGELAQRLQVSAAAVSGAVRYLVGLGLIRRGREPGARRDCYRVLPDIWHETFTARDNLLERWQASAAEGVEVVGPDTQAGRRLAETEEFFGFLRTQLRGVLERWSEHRAIWAAGRVGERAGESGPGGFEGRSGRSNRSVSGRRSSRRAPQ